MDVFSLVSSCRMCHPLCNLCDPFCRLPRWIRARLSTESPCGPFSSRRSDGRVDLHFVRAVFTLSYSCLPLPFPQDTTFFQCEQIFFVFISKVYINENVLLYLSVMSYGRAEGVHSLDLSSLLCKPV